MEEVTGSNPVPPIRSRPTRHFEAGDPLEVGEVTRYEGCGKREGMRGNLQVHGADGLAGLFELVPNAAVMGGAGRADVIEHKARRSIPRFQLGLRALAAQEFVGELLDTLEEDLPGVFRDHEKPLAGALEVDGVCLDAKLLR